MSHNALYQNLCDRHDDGSVRETNGRRERTKRFPVGRPPQFQHLTDRSIQPGYHIIYLIDKLILIIHYESTMSKSSVDWFKQSVE